MKRLRVIGVGMVVILGIFGVGLLEPHSKPQDVGTLASSDLVEILRLVQQDLREYVLPEAELENVLYPQYVARSIADYSKQRILWVEAHDDDQVEVYAGVSRDMICDEGHSWSLEKTTNWTITGYAYWASSNVAPAGIQVPPL